MNTGQPATADHRAARTLVQAVLAGPLVALALLAATHFLVDIVAATTNPLWPTLEEHLRLPTGGLLWVYVAWSIATSFSQLLFGFWADRIHSRWLIWAGPCLAILSICCVGLVTSPWALAVLLVVGGLGIASFHPEAAATAGSLLPQHRSRAMAIFALCGYLGQAAGPIYSGLVTDHWGVRGLQLGLLWGLPSLLVLALGLTVALRLLSDSSARSQPAAVPVEPASVEPGSPADSGSKLAIILLLLAVGALRILPALGVPLSLAYVLKSTDASNQAIGAAQSAFMAGIGLGAMACAAFVRRRSERTVLWLMPLIAAPLLAALAYLTGWTLVVGVGTCGSLLGVTMPVYISYGQQLLPHGQRVASAITMGVSWGIGGGIVAGVLWLCMRWDTLSSIFGFFAVAAVVSGVLCYFLPAPDPAT